MEEAKKLLIALDAGAAVTDGARPMTPDLRDPMLDVSVFCVECGRPALDRPDGWLACIGGGIDDEPIELAAYCPACAAREFGGAPAVVPA